MPGHSERYDLRPLRAAVEERQGEAKAHRPPHRFQVTEGEKRKLGAVAYSERTGGTAEEHAAIASVVLNRVSSRDLQYVDRGRAVSIDNVIAAEKQFQAVGRSDYDAFKKGTASGPASKNAAKAVDQVLKTGPTTNATFFIVNPGGRRPTDKEVRALGKVEAANPPRIGDVYLYKLKAPEAKGRAR
jgi:spore germination cell wall hydrolase CwlJ-like protein